MNAQPLKRQSSPTIASTASAWLTVDLDAIRANYRRLKQEAGNAAVAGIVKADAYGLGMKEILPVLEGENCPFYFVATLDEALSLRPLTDKPIAMLGGLWNGCEDEYMRHNITPVLNSFEEIQHWQARARSKNTALPVIIHFDTGMNRLGLSAANAATLIENPDSLEGLNVQLIMSHLACADEKDSPMNDEQFRKFSAVAHHFPLAQKSLANSFGLFRSPDYAFDMVRPGIALYGGNPTLETENPMKSVVSLNARILQVRTALKNETIGYNATYRFKEKSRIATVAIGYADGFFRSNSNAAFLYLNGSPCPVVGRVSMDLVTIDIGDLPATPGDTVEIIGLHQSIDPLAQRNGTISYEILTALGTRCERYYAANICPQTYKTPP